MQQMPEEGRLFQTVDRNWKDVMKNTVKDPHVSRITTADKAYSPLTKL